MFHGLSSPDELQSTWFNMTEGQDLPTLKVIWEFDDDALNSVLTSEGLYVCNLTYKYIGNHTGHYIAFSNKDNQIIYFDPLGTLPPDWIISKIKDKRFVIDLEGAQAISGTSCGYRCLTKLLKYSLGVMPKYKISKSEDLKDLKTQTIKKTKREIEILKNLQKSNI